MDDSFTYQCPHCGDEGHIPAKYAGVSIRCPKCSKVFVVGDDVEEDGGPGFLSRAAGAADAFWQKVRARLWRPRSEPGEGPPVARTPAKAPKQMSENERLVRMLCKAQRVTIGDGGAFAIGFALGLIAVGGALFLFLIVFGLLGLFRHWPG